MSATASRAAQDVVEIQHAKAPGAPLVLCEHASPNIPSCYDKLGLTDAAQTSHAAWDPGARAVALHLVNALQGSMVASRVSRLVYDCNRPPEAASATPDRVEYIDIPGNRGLTADQRAERVARVYAPFCDAVNRTIARCQPSCLITVHSFTPVYFDQPRTVEIGIVHDSDSQMADTMLANAAKLPHRLIRRNDPYGPKDGVTHSLKLHGIAHGLPNVMIELRNDLLADNAAQANIAQEVLSLLHPAISDLPAPRPGGRPHA